MTLRAITLVSMVALCGCAIPLRTLPVGAVTNVAAPIAATGEIGCTGESHVSTKAYSLFGLVAWGDASIERARTDLLSDFRLSRLTTVDYRLRSRFGVTVYETVVCGFFVRNQLRSHGEETRVAAGGTSADLVRRPAHRASLSGADPVASASFHP